jgi:hypothetical protein
MQSGFPQKKKHYYSMLCVVRDVLRTKNMSITVVNVSDSVRGKCEIKILIGPHAGKIVLAKSARLQRDGYYVDGVVIPELDNLELWGGKISGNQDPDREYDNLYTPWDGNGNRILIGDKVLYSKDKSVYVGTVTAFNEPFHEGYGYWLRSIKIKEESGKSFKLNDPTRCLRMADLPR